MTAIGLPCGAGWHPAADWQSAWPPATHIESAIINRAQDAIQAASLRPWREDR
jgi:hypothetical protein